MTPLDTVDGRSSSAAIASQAPPVRALLLAGSFRTARAQPLARSLGVPLAALPVDAHRTVLSWWIESFYTSKAVRSVTIAVSDPEERTFYERVIADTRLQCEIWIDRNEHRGAGGTIRDFADDTLDSDEHGIVVAECSTFGDFVFDSLFTREVMEAHAAVLMSRDRLPSGVMFVSRRAIELIPTVGYFDLKEQLLPAIAKGGGRTRAIDADGAPYRIGTLRGYLDLVQARAQQRILLISQQSTVDPTADIRGASLIGRGAVVGARAVVSDAVVMSGAQLGEGAIVARSVIPPGAVVPPSARIIDEVFAPLGTSGRDVR
jgi:hypothetical protein